MAAEASRKPGFNLLRFSMVMAAAIPAFGWGKNVAESSRALFAIGMLLLAVFAGFHDPLSKTPREFKPSTCAEWIGVYSGIVGAALVTLSLLQRVW